MSFTVGETIEICRKMEAGADAFHKSEMAEYAALQLVNVGARVTDVKGGVEGNGDGLRIRMTSAFILDFKPIKFQLVLDKGSSTGMIACSARTCLTICADDARSKLWMRINAAEPVSSREVAAQSVRAFERIAATQKQVWIQRYKGIVASVSGGLASKAAGLKSSYEIEIIASEAPNLPILGDLTISDVIARELDPVHVVKSGGASVKNVEQSFAKAFKDAFGTDRTALPDKATKKYFVTRHEKFAKPSHTNIRSILKTRTTSAPTFFDGICRAIIGPSKTVIHGFGIGHATETVESARTSSPYVISGELSTRVATPF